MTGQRPPTALILIDIQNDYWKPPRLPREAFTSTVSALLDFGRESGLTVIHVQHARRDPGRPSFQPGTPGYEIHPCAAPLPDEIRVVKHTPGSFFGTSLDDILRARGIQDVVISGMQTQRCCDTTTREASARGYRPFFITDAVETFDLTGPFGNPVDRDDVNRVTFAALANGFATVLPFDEFRKR